MSSNADAYREFFRRFNERELDELTDVMHADYTHHMRTDEPDARTLNGIAEYQEVIATWSEAFDEFRAELHELIEKGDTMIAVTTIHGRGHGSGAEVHEPYVFVTRYRDGKAAETFEYHTKDEALASLG